MISGSEQRTAGEYEALHQEVLKRQWEARRFGDRASVSIQAQPQNVQYAGYPIQQQQQTGYNGYNAYNNSNNVGGYSTQNQPTNQVNVLPQNNQIQVNSMLSQDLYRNAAAMPSNPQNPLNASTSTTMNVNSNATKVVGPLSANHQAQKKEDEEEDDDNTVSTGNTVPFQPADWTAATKEDNKPKQHHTIIANINATITPSESPQSPKRRNVVFDPVPGLFPKILVDRILKEREVEVIVHGPKKQQQVFSVVK